MISLNGDKKQRIWLSVLISRMLLESREKFNVTTKTTTLVSGKTLNIVRIDRKKHSHAIHKSLKKNYDNFVNCDVVVFVVKNHYQITQNQEIYTTSCNNFTYGFSKWQTRDQYAPILDTLTMLLKHEYLSGEVLNRPKTNTNKYNCYSDRNIFKKNFWNTSEGIKLEMILYHDDFNIGNPLGYKASKYKVPAFYLVLENLTENSKLYITDIHVVGLTQARVIRYKIWIWKCSGASDKW